MGAEGAGGGGAPAPAPAPGAAPVGLPAGAGRAAMLRARPGGAYTTARRGAAGRAPELWGAHAARLARSAALLWAAGELPEPAGGGGSAAAGRAVQRLACEAVARGYEAWRRSGGGAAPCTLTMLLHPGPVAGMQRCPETGLVCEVAVGPCSSAPAAPAAAAVVEGWPGRRLPRAKWSAWALERAPLEKLKAPGECEVLMAPGGLVLEGCVTNFFVITASDGASGAILRTAGADVLPGLIREEVLALAPGLGLAVDLSPPRLDEAEEWQEAFVTSCVRLVQPVSSLRRLLPDGSSVGEVRIRADRGPWTQRISEQLQERLRASVQNESLLLNLAAHETTTSHK